jgi:hypothetical protein
MTAVMEVTLNCDANLNDECHHWIQTQERTRAKARKEAAQFGWRSLIWREGMRIRVDYCPSCQSSMPAA